MSMKGFLRRMSKKTGNANVWSDVRARDARNSACFNHKKEAARKAAANAELARAFADIFRAPTHEHEGIFAKNEQKDRECECVERCESAGRAKQRVL
jgi:hypothetical protein